MNEPGTSITKNISLQAKFENAVIDCEKIYDTKNNLENVIETLHSKLAAAELKNDVVTKQLLSEVDSNATTKNEAMTNLENEMQKKTQEVLDLANKSDKFNNVVKRLNKELYESKANAKKELIGIEKDFKAEIKSWRKELGEETKKRIKLEEKLKELKNEDEDKHEKHANLAFTATTTGSAFSVQPNSNSTSEVEIECTICAESIVDYIPKYFLGEEINPACEDCQDSSISSKEDQNFEEPLT